MSSIYGIWKHETAAGESSVITTQTIREDGSYETHMIFVLGAGCRQHVYHYGRVMISEATLKLIFDSGKTEMTGCEDSSKNFDLRGFTSAEIEDARSLLAQEIPYTIENDTLTTTVKGPMGQLNVEYRRQVK